MTNDADLIGGIVVIFRGCFEMSRSIPDDRIRPYATRLLKQIRDRRLQYGDDRRALHMEVAKIPNELRESVKDSVCKDITERIMKMIKANT
jgi:hypothetical protein